MLEHLPNPLAELLTLRRKLSSAGTLIIEVPRGRDFLISAARNKAFIEHTLWSQHLVLHTRDSLDLLLRAAGFDNVLIAGVQRYGLANHLGWLSSGTPGGHKGPLSAVEDEALRSSYEAWLARLDATDTLVAIAK